MSSPQVTESRSEPVERSSEQIAIANRRVRWSIWVGLLMAVLFCMWRLVPHSWTASTTDSAQVASLSDTAWNQAMTALDTQNSTLAIAYVQRSMGKPSLKPQRAILQGRLLLERGKPLAADQLFREAGQSAPWQSRARYWSGAAAYAAGNTAAAEAAWSEVLVDAPDNAQAHRSLAMFYYDVGAIDHAVEHLQKLTALDRDDSRPYRLLGLIFFDYERYQDAVNYYRAALDRDLSAQTRDQVRRELTSCFLKLGDFQRGLEVIESASETLDALVLKADCLVGLGEQERAVELLTNVLERDTHHHKGLVSMGEAQLVGGSAEKAVTHLRRAVAEQPNDYLSNFKLAQALRGAGAGDEAEQVAARAEEIKLKRENFAKLHRDATASPRDAEIRYQLGVTAEELGMPELATTWFKAVLQLDDQHVEARRRLTDLTASPKSMQANSKLDSSQVTP